MDDSLPMTGGNPLDDGITPSAANHGNAVSNAAAKSITLIRKRVFGGAEKLNWEEHGEEPYNVEAYAIMDSTHEVITRTGPGVISAGVAAVLFLLAIWAWSVTAVRRGNGAAMLNAFEPRASDRVHEGNERALRDWARTGVGSLDDRAFLSGYAEVAIYPGASRAPKNVSISRLEVVLNEACEAEKGECLCLSALHLGVGVNAVIMREDDTGFMPFMIDPEVQSSAAETFNARYGDGRVVDRPVWAIAEYRNADGSKSRSTLLMEKAACLLECLELAGK